MARFEFDSLEDFQVFAAFCGYVKDAGERAAYESCQSPSYENAGDASETGAGTLGATGNEQAADKPKRTRKPKADAASAAAQPSDTSGTTSAVAAESVSQSATSTANPFAASGAGASTATQAILAAENQQQATLAGIAAMQESVEAEDAPGAEPMTAPQHMHLCRQFIAKHGQQKYMEAFQLAGLSASIAAYTPEQRATHAATLAALDL